MYVHFKLLKSRPQDRDNAGNLTLVLIFMDGSNVQATTSQSALLLCMNNNLSGPTTDAILSAAILELKCGFSGRAL